MKSENETQLDLQTIPINCTVCDSKEYKPLFLIPPRQIVECKNCGHEYVNPIVPTKDIPDCVFQLNEEESPSTKIDSAYLKNIFHKFNIKPGKILDVGCGQGRLARGLINLGWKEQDIYLMDNSKSGLEIATKKYPLSKIVFGDAQESIPFNNYFDNILMIGFFEHVANPKKTLENALYALKDEGLLCIRGMPNNESLEAFIGQDRWRMRQFIHHFQFFNHSTFSRLINQFKDANIVDLDVFLQEKSDFYNISRIARNIGIVKETNGDEHSTYDFGIVKTEDLTNLVLQKIRSTNFENYKHKDKYNLKKLYEISSTKDIEEFYEEMQLNKLVSADFSVVIRKERDKINVVKGGKYD